jgi:hypothetical protein
VIVHAEECTLCHQNFVFDSNRNLWFKEEDYEIYGFRWLGAECARKPVRTQGGFVCSQVCLDEHTEDEELLAVVNA